MVNLKKFLKYTKEDSLVRDSFVLFIASMVMNFASFLYHFVMGRMLGPDSYGILGVALSLFYILLVPLYVIQTSISKFVAGYKAKKDKKSIGNLFVRSFNRLFIVSLFVMLVSFVLSFFLDDYLKIPTSILWTITLSAPFVLLLPIERGLLQGIQNFKSLGYNMITETVARFVIGLALVFFGFGVFGAVFGIVGSFIVAFGFGFFALKKYFKKSKKPLDTKAVYKYSWPVFVVLLALTLFYSLDVTLVKHYFDDTSAGYYSAFAILGRIAFFASFAIVFVLFPKVAEAHALGKANISLLKKAMLLVTIVCGGVVLFYLLFPKLAVLVLFGSQYLEITKYIALFATVMSLFSYVYLLAFYNLSINRVGFVYYLFLLDIVEVLLLIRFHSSLMQVVFVLLGLIFLAFIFMLFYTFVKNGKTVNSNSMLQ